MVQMYSYSDSTPIYHFMFHMNYVIEGSGALVNEKGEKKPH